MNGRRRWGLLVFTGIAAAGCDPVASKSYQGEVLATLQGLVTPGAEAPSIPLEVALVWGQPDGKSLKLIAEKVPIIGQFPAEFTVQLHHPPPKEAGTEIGGARISTAFIAALAKNDWTQGTLLPASKNVLAYAVANEMLVHLDRDVPAGEGVAGLLGIHTAGFHLIEEVPVGADEAQAAAEACRKVFPSEPPESCAPQPALTQGQFLVPREVKDGLAHKINLELMFPDFVVVSGGDDEPAPPCAECTDMASRPSMSPDGGASDSDGGGMGASGGAHPGTH
jgi:hypothetical protein